MNVEESRRRVWWAAAALMIALAAGGCGKEQPAPGREPAAKPQAPSASIARIHAMEGDVRIVGARGEERAQAGVLIDRSEAVRTMAGAWALLAMSDGATITMRADTELRFDDYRYDPDGEAQQNTASLSLVKGALRSITGVIGQTNPGGYQVKTPTATIGIRGTDHEPAYYPPPPPGQKAEHPPGTYDKVNVGETVIRRPAGEVAVRRGQTAYAPVEVKSRPQILERAPVFYQRHAEVDRRVVDRREEFNRQFVEQQQRRQQERERVRQLQEQKQREAQKQRLIDDQKKKQDEQKREREKQREGLKQKQEEARKKQQEEQKKKQEVAKSKQEEARKKQEEAKKAQAERKAAGKAAGQEQPQKAPQQQQQRQQQREQLQQKQQERQQQLRQQQQERQQQQQQLRQQQQERQQQQQLRQQQQQQRQPQQQPQQRGRDKEKDRDKRER